MIKSYYNEEDIILPFCNVSSNYYNKNAEVLYVYVIGEEGKYILRNDAINSFKSQYLAWLDSQSTKQLT